MNNNLSSLLNWKLLKGSHRFPGPDGGTCINEAAIVVAGFKYKSITNSDDCPPCFSKAFSTYLIVLNDKMPDNQRQKLIPFAVKLVGSADTKEIEVKRVEYIILETCKRILAPTYDALNIKNEFASVQNMKDVKTVADRVLLIAATYGIIEAVRAAVVAYTANIRVAAVRTARAAADATARAADCWDVVAWDIAIDILNEAMEIGNKAEPIEHELIEQRIKKAKKEKVEEN